MDKTAYITIKIEKPDYRVSERWFDNAVGRCRHIGGIFDATTKTWDLPKRHGMVAEFVATPESSRWAGWVLVSMNEAAPAMEATEEPSSTMISSQRYRDEEIVAAKRAAGDYRVVLTPRFKFQGDICQLVLDGHHAYEAALADGVEPEWVLADEHTCPELAILHAGDVVGFLEACRNNSDYYNLATGAALS